LTSERAHAKPADLTLHRVDTLLWFLKGLDNMDLIHERIARHASETPSRIAAKDGNGSLSYGVLNANSNFVAGKLEELGVSGGDVIAVYVPYAKEVVTGALAAWKLGGIFMPMDEVYPPERLEYMLENSEARALLTCRSLWETKPLHYDTKRIVFLDDLPEKAENPACPQEISPGSPGMLLYTSGTTGRPKGVLHRYALLSHFTDWIDESVAVNADSRTAILTRFPFVGTVMFLFGTLFQGGTACFAPEAARMDVESLYHFLRQEKITHAFIPSGLAAMLAEDYDIAGIHVFAAGEKLRNFKAYSPGTCLWNSYGATETGGVLLTRVRGTETPIPIGKPAAKTKAILVDENMEPVPPGEAGELLVSSEYMSLQYFKLPELTAEKWVKKDGHVWYRTGDRAKCTEEGIYYFLDRVDNMVKLRGFRIETGEVEMQVANAVKQMRRNDVKDIVVTLKTVRNTDRLVCYYEASRELDLPAIRESISKSLADYMMPELWVMVPSMPRNANGKILRQELPLPKRRAPEEGALYSEVLTRVIWAAEDVLGDIGMISPSDRFTDLGGNSLLAMKFSTLLRAQGIKASTAQILQLNELQRVTDAAEVDYSRLWSQEQYQTIMEDFAARGEHIEKVLPLTTEQDERLFQQIIYPEQNDCRFLYMLELDSLISEEDLRHALDRLAQENEELRAAVVFHHTPVIQQVITDRKIPLEMVQTEKTAPRKLMDFRRQLMRLSVDPQRNSLLQVICVTGGGHNFLFILAFCILFDKRSLRQYYVDLLSLLEEKYPQDSSIREWKEIIQLKPDAAPPKGGSPGPSEKRNTFTEAVQARRHVPPEIRIYSENAGPRMVFVHTANTGGEAYYRLADRIKDYMSFAAIEPFNLYHPQEASYGIQKIAERYVRTLKKHQPKGPYILGGWCYGGIIAHEMACQLEQAGEQVQHLFMFDSHAITNEKVRDIARAMFRMTSREYFETCPLFEDMREDGMLEALIQNYLHVSEDTVHHTPSFFHGNVTYFKPEEIPAGQSGTALAYWKRMMEFDAGGYENFCDRNRLKIVHTPHEHDLMMDDPSLDIIVPEIYRATMNGTENV